MTELRELVVAAQHGDQNAFGQIVLRFQDMAYALGYAMLGDAHLAQDAAQDAFVDAYLSLKTLREPAAFPGWFRRVVLKHCDRQLRQRRREIPLDDVRELPSDDYEPSESLEAMYMRQRVHDAMDELPDRQRLIASLFYLDGYSQQEIVDFLELPVTTVKKQLFLARKKLREGMEDMATQVMTNRPSQTDALANKVQFFIALRQHDVPRVKKLIESNPELLTAYTEWGVVENSNYWPLGYTALHWAVVTDDAALFDALIEKGADVNAPSKNWKAAPLHVAAMMRRSDMTRRLIAAKADVKAVNAHGHTPLHIAAYTGDVESATALLAAGASVNAKDDGGHTPLDWAIHRRRDALVELLKSRAANSNLQTPTFTPPDRSTSVLETGLKIIDFCAPMKRGGVNAIFTPKSGVGKVVFIEYLIQLMAEHYGGHSIFLDVEHASYTAEGLALEFRDIGLDHAIALVIARENDAASFVQAVNDVLAEAARLSAAGRNAFIFADAMVADQAGLQARLESAAHDAERGAVTVIWYGNLTAGAEPEHFAHLDSVVTFDVWRAYQGLWPAHDALNSWSTVQAGERHASLLRNARRLLRRFEDLRTIIERDPRGMNALDTDEDRRIVERARRLHAFFSQPYPVAELFTNLLGEYVPLKDTLDGVEAILEGKADDIPEDKLRFIGGMDRYFRR